MDANLVAYLCNFFTVHKVHSLYHIHTVHPSVRRHFLIAGQLSGKLRGPALLQANALPTELRRTHF